MPEVKEKLLYPVPEGAWMLSMGPRTLWEKIKNGEIEVRKIGRRIYLTRESLQKFARGR
jgi:hypothetical protein